MSMTVEEYQQRWEIAPPWEQKLTPTSCIVDELITSSMVGSCYNILSDFGDAICLYRYAHFKEEFEDKDEGKLSAEDIARKEAAQQYLDALLERFVQDGYQSGMDEELKHIVNTYFVGYEFYGVYFLPEDLSRILEVVGNPLVDWKAEDEEAAIAAAPPFDLNNSEHREALTMRLWEAN